MSSELKLKVKSMHNVCIPFLKKERKYQKILIVVDYEWWIMGYFYFFLVNFL